MRPRGHNRLFTGRAVTELMIGVLAKGASFRFQAKGFSMSPFIRDGDVMVISPLRDHSLGRGHVAAFQHPRGKRLVVHRVVGKRGDSFLLKGDNVPTADGYVQAENILGYVSRVERDGKKVFLGAGPERFVIALLSSRGWLPPLLRALRPAVTLYRSMKGFLSS